MTALPFLLLASELDLLRNPFFGLPSSPECLLSEELDLEADPLPPPCLSLFFLSLFDWCLSFAFFCLISDLDPHVPERGRGSWSSSALEVDVGRGWEPSS